MLTKTDFSELDKRTKKIVEKVVKDNNKEIYEHISKSISDNNNKLFEVLATKQDVTKAIYDNNGKLFDIFPTKQYLDENFVTKTELQESTNRIMDVLDKIYGVVKKMDVEQTVMSRNLQNHEVRITKVEAVVFS